MNFPYNTVEFYFLYFETLLLVVYVSVFPNELNHF